MTYRPRLIVSPVGISLFINLLRNDRQRRERVLQYSNDATNDLPQDITAEIANLKRQANATLRDGDAGQRRRLSAELNGLYGFYRQEQKAFPKDDIHLLVCTDTALGQAAGDVLHDFLQTQYGQQVIPLTPTGLTTRDVVSFTQGIKFLIKNLDEQIATYDAKNYEIIFNLTGGFKSLQGYLTVVAMFYADRLVYIFERSEELLSIPRLPIRLDEGLLRANAVALALMEEAGAVLPADSLKLPDALLEVDEQGDATLSGWGTLLWQRTRDDILNDNLLDFPYLHYEASFKKDFNDAERPERVRLQKTLAEVSEALSRTRGDVSVLKQHGGLQYDDYTNRTASYGGKRRRLGHFRVSQAMRVSCVFYDGQLHLRRFGREQDVNSNP